LGERWFGKGLIERRMVGRNKDWLGEGKIAQKGN